jgi:MFS family permease
MAAISAGGAFFYPASNGALPNLVDDDQLTPASVLMSLAWGTTAALGAALGGQVGAVLGRDAAFLIDAASFAIGAGLVVGIHRPFAASTVSKMPGFVTSARETLGYARRHGPVAALLTSKFSFGLTVGAIAMFPILSTEVFDAGDRGTGLLFAARGLGVLVGPLLARRFFGRSDARLLSVIGPCITLWGISYLVMSISTSLAVAAVLVGIAHMGGGSQWTFSTYGLQRLVPDRLRGRVFGFDYGLLSLSASVSNLLAGLAAEHLGARTVVAGAGVFAAVFGLGWAALTRRFWRQLNPA